VGVWGHHSPPSSGSAKARDMLAGQLVENFKKKSEKVREHFKKYVDHVLMIPEKIRPSS
jgi:hypothetical protein